MLDERTIQKYKEKFLQVNYTIEQLLDIAESNFHLYEKVGLKEYKAQQLAAERIIIEKYKEMERKIRDGLH